MPITLARRALTTMAESQPTNFFGGSPLNRLAWLRTSPPFLAAAAASPAARWLLLRDGKLLFAASPAGRALARLTTPAVRALLGPPPLFAQGEKKGEHAAEGVSVLESARLRGPGIVFLGLHEPPHAAQALPSADFGKADAAGLVAKIEGTLYFALDVSGIEEGQLDEALKETEEAKEGKEMVFVDARSAMNSMDYFEGGLVASARAMVDWNARNKFCAACGSPVYSLWAGWKLSCSTLLPWAAGDATRKACPTAVGLHNQAHPRTDAVVIMAVVNPANDKILLGRNKKWPGRFYSTLAGFIEPGEAFEDAVKRELWEEAGLKVWGVKYHSTQPWPFPANLMIGFYAIADDTQPTRTDLDNELEDARWYTRQEILDVLDHPGSNNKMATDPFRPTDPNVPEPPFRLPPLTAIAGVLIRDWAHLKFVVTGPDARASSL